MPRPEDGRCRDALRRSGRAVRCPRCGPRRRGASVDAEQRSDDERRPSRRARGRSAAGRRWRWLRPRRDPSDPVAVGGPGAVRPRLDLDGCAPNGSAATPIVLRAGRESPKPATYASLNVANVSMSVRKHSVLATSASDRADRRQLRAQVLDGLRGLRLDTALDHRAVLHAELTADDDPLARLDDGGVRTERLRWCRAHRAQCRSDVTGARQRALRTRR